MKRFFVLFSALALIFSSCSFFESDEQTGICIQLPESAERAAAAVSTIQNYSGLNYRAEVTAGSSTYTAVPEENETSIFMEVPEGSCTVTLYAYLDDIKVAGGSKTVTVVSGKETPVSVTLAPLDVKPLIKSVSESTKYTEAASAYFTANASYIPLSSAALKFALIKSTTRENLLTAISSVKAALALFGPDDVVLTELILPKGTSITLSASALSSATTSYSYSFEYTIDEDTPDLYMAVTAYDTADTSVSDADFSSVVHMSYSKLS